MSGDTEKRPVGRPTLYKEHYPEQARKLCLLGSTDEDLADFFEVSVDTINEWKKVHPDFSASIKKGKVEADSNVADRLYQRAMGYEHAEVDIRVIDREVIKTPMTKIYAPDPTAAIFWLKNRQRAKWRDRVETEHSGFIGVESLTDEQLAAKIAEKQRLLSGGD